MKSQAWSGSSQSGSIGGQKFNFFAKTFARGHIIAHLFVFYQHIVTLKGQSNEIFQPPVFFIDLWVNIFLNNLTPLGIIPGGVKKSAKT